MTSVWLASYALAVHGARRLLPRGAIRRVLDAVSGIALVTFGGVLAFERRP